MPGIAAGITSSAQFAHHLAFLLLDLADPDFARITRAHAAAVETAIADVLTAARAAGELPDLPDAELDALPRAVHAAYNGALVTWGMTSQGSPADAVRAQLLQLLAARLLAVEPEIS